MTLVEWLRIKGWSPADLADQIGVSRQAVYGWLNGEFYPAYENLLSLSEITEGQVALDSFRPDTEAANG